MSANTNVYNDNFEFDIVYYTNRARKERSRATADLVRRIFNRNH